MRPRQLRRDELLPHEQLLHLIEDGDFRRPERNATKYFKRGGSKILLLSAMSYISSYKILSTLRIWWVIHSRVILGIYMRVYWRKMRTVIVAIATLKMVTVW